jgi:hypothetical protein
VLGNLEMSRKDGSCVAGGISLLLGDTLCPQYPRRRQISKPLLDSFGTGSEAVAIDRFSFFVECAVMAPEISKVDTNRHLDPSWSVWTFRDELLRWLFHG